jgi:hypothetical protein
VSIDMVSVAQVVATNSITRPVFTPKRLTNKAEELGKRHTECLQDVGERIGAAGELGEAVLDKPETHDQPQGDRREAPCPPSVSHVDSRHGWPATRNCAVRFLRMTTRSSGLGKQRRSNDSSLLSSSPQCSGETSTNP